LSGAASKHLSQRRDKVGLLIGLAQHLKLLALQIIAMHQFFSVTRRQQHFDARLEFTRSDGNFAPRKAARHDKIREYEIDRTIPVKDIERLGTVAGLEDLVANHLKARDSELAHAGVVFHDKDDLARADQTDP
jgi:hypothetical protein